MLTATDCQTEIRVLTETYDVCDVDMTSTGISHHVVLVPPVEIPLIDGLKPVTTYALTRGILVLVMV